MTSTLSPSSRTAPRRVAVLTRLLVALVAGAAAVLVLALVRGGTGGPAAVAPAAPVPVAPVAVATPGAGAPVDALATAASPRDDRRWSEQDGVLQRDCSAVHGCGPWYDTSYAPGEAPPMDGPAAQQLPVLDAARSS